MTRAVWRDQNQQRNKELKSSISLSTEDIAMHERGCHLSRIFEKHVVLSCSFLYLAGGLCWYSDTPQLRSVSCPRVSDISFACVQSIAAVSLLMSQGITHTEWNTNTPLLRQHSTSFCSIFFAEWLVFFYLHIQISKHAHTHITILVLKHCISSVLPFSSVTWRAESILHS